MDSQKYKSAVGRNLAELQWAIVHRTTLQGISAVPHAHSIFLHSTYTGVFNDYIAHSIKVFERSANTASFWYIYRTHEQRVRDFTGKNGIDFQALEAVSAKLKHIRNKTHFHIDSEGVLDPTAIWKQAGLTGDELAGAIDAAWKILIHLQQLLGLREVNLPHYTIADAQAAAQRAERPQDSFFKPLRGSA